MTLIHNSYETCGNLPVIVECPHSILLYTSLQDLTHETYHWALGRTQY